MENMGEILKRHKGNPILKPQDDVVLIFNPGASLRKDGTIDLYPRIIYERDFNDYISRIGYYKSEDGYNFRKVSHNFIEPSKEYDKWGCEDPRVTKIEEAYYFTYVALSKPVREGGGPPATALVSTEDFINFNSYGVITPEASDNKDVVLFPEKFNGEYVMLHRPHRWTKSEAHNLPYQVPSSHLPEKPSIWIAFSDNLKDWKKHKVLMEPEYEWEKGKIGAGAPPIKTEAGWLLIYHGMVPGCYRAGVALLDLKNPSKVIARSRDPILEPKEDYEKFGHVNNVVFPEGCVVLDDMLYVYYGAADRCVCLATCNLDDLLSVLYKR